MLNVPFFQQPVNQYLFTALTALVLTIPLLPATASEEVIAPPAAPTATNQRTAIDQKYEQFLNETLDADWSNIIKDVPSLDGVQYDAVAGVQRSDADLQQANADTQTMLMMQGQSVQSAIEDAYNMGQFQPSLIGGNSAPYLADQIREGNRVRAGLNNNIRAEQQRIVEESFQPKRVQDVVR